MKIGRFRVQREEPDILKGVLAGLVAGFVATYAKDKFQTKWSEWTEALEPAKPEGQHKPPTPSEEPATVKAAQAVSKRALHRDLTKKEKEMAGPLVDYGFGALAGLAYGGVTEVVPEVAMAGGTAFGAAVWLLGDEIGVPLAGLAKWPNKYPASTHAYALGGHLVYGAATELLRRIIRKAMD